MAGVSDRDDIAELVHEYSDAVIHRDETRWAACWTVDATWSLPGGRDVAGREAIVELWRTSLAAYDAVVQHVHSGSVRVDGDAATGRWHIAEHCRRVDGSPAVMLAYYDDHYRREQGGWRIARRALVVQYKGAPDLSGLFTVPGAPA